MAKFRTNLNDILVNVSWGQITLDYFGKKPLWLHHKLEAEVGCEDCFTDEELLQFKGALCDLADRIRRVADSL